MPLAMKVGLGPDHIVLDGEPGPPTERGTAAPTFRPTLLLHSRPATPELSCKIYFVAYWLTFSEVAASR